MSSILTIKVSGNAGCQADVYVARYEVYPNVDPTVCTPNGLSGYWDIVVPNADIKEGDDPNTIAGYAWNGVTDSITGLKDTIVPWAETEMVKSTIIGEQFAKIEEEGE